MIKSKTLRIMYAIKTNYYLLLLIVLFWLINQIKQDMTMTSIILIGLAVLILIKWEFFENLAQDFLAIGGLVICLAVMAGLVWLTHRFVFDSWLVSAAVVFIGSIGYYKYAGE